jgi:hypothetical protein
MPLQVSPFQEISKHALPPGMQKIRENSGWKRFLDCLWSMAKLPDFTSYHLPLIPVVTYIQAYRQMTH